MQRVLYCTGIKTYNVQANNAAASEARTYEKEGNNTLTGRENCEGVDLEEATLIKRQRNIRDLHLQFERVAGGKASEARGNGGWKEAVAVS